MRLLGKSGRFYELEASCFASGGEGEVYNIIGQPNLVAKIYKNNKNTPEKERKLAAMLKRPLHGNMLSQVAWPKDVVYRGNMFAGYIMAKFQLHEVLNVIYEYGSAAKYPQMPWKNKITIALNLCAVLDSVHDSGHVCGDLNPKNISVDPKTGRIIFVDADSFHINEGGATYRCDVGIPEYLPYEVQRKMRGKDNLGTAPLPTFSQNSDNFALAIHIFQLLMNGVHPFACAIVPNQSSVVAPQPSDNIIKGIFPFMQKVTGIKIPVYAPEISILPQEIQTLFFRAFVEGHNNPNRRPTAEEWHQTLSNLQWQLTSCNVFVYHQYYRTLPACPWCDVNKKFIQTLKPVIPMHQTLIPPTPPATSGMFGHIRSLATKPSSLLSPQSGNSPQTAAATAGNGAILGKWNLLYWCVTMLLSLGVSLVVFLFVSPIVFEESSSSGFVESVVNVMCTFAPHLVFAGGMGGSIYNNIKAGQKFFSYSWKNYILSVLSCAGGTVGMGVLVFVVTLAVALTLYLIAILISVIILISFISGG